MRPAWEVTARRYHEDEAFSKWTNAFLSYADLGIQGVEFKPTGQSMAPPEPYFIHSGDKGATVQLSFWNESNGTRQLFNMLARLSEVLREGKLAVVDELGASLHPSLVRAVPRFTTRT